LTDITEVAIWKGNFIIFSTVAIVEIKQGKKKVQFWEKIGGKTYFHDIDLYRVIDNILEQYPELEPSEDNDEERMEFKIA
jgi:hypothetical protein